MLPQMDDRIQSAAEALEQYFLGMHRDDRGVHVNTLLSTTAAVVAEAILRATVQEDQLYMGKGMLFSEGAEDLFYRADDGNVLNYLAFTAQEVGLTALTMPDIEEIFRATAAAADKSPIPVLTVPEDQQPKFWALEGATRARPSVLEIYQRYALTPEEAVLAVTLVLCRILNGTQKVLKPVIAFRLALETLVGAIRLHPVSPKDLEQMKRHD